MCSVRLTPPPAQDPDFAADPCRLHSVREALASVLGAYAYHGRAERCERIQQALTFFRVIEDVGCPEPSLVYTLRTLLAQECEQ